MRICSGGGQILLDFDDIELDDHEAVSVQIAERSALIDRLHGEIQRLELALMGSRNAEGGAR